MSLQFNFRVHPCILIKICRLIFFFLQNINLYPLPSVVEVKYAWNFYTPSKSICLFPCFLSFLELFSIFLEGSSYRRNRMLYCILSWLSVLIVVSGVLGFIPFLVSFRFVWFLGHFFILNVFLVKQSVKNDLEKSISLLKSA